MKIRLITLALLLCPVVLEAQMLDGAFFGSVGAGLAAHDNGAFSRRLKQYTPLKPGGEEYVYQTRDFSTAGTVVSGSIGWMFGGRYVIGAAAEQVSYPEMNSINAPGNPRDRYLLAAQGAGLDFGYAVVNRAGMLVYPYGHLGYYGYTLDYTNNQPTPIPFFEGKPVASGATATYTGSAPRWALGVNMVKFIGATPAPGSLAITARLSWGMMFSRPAWKEPGGDVVNNGGLTPGYNGVALTIGIGGGFSW
ncbi:MAG: hypothetical protein JST22_13220 [Bacteroidetes bacterium]|nr:hypothetical protein [Bacteroidota bacterium]